ncbi:MAG: RsmE family RNA methyltransferase [Candidatus Paceibacterota bacterium]|jgi:16S rRNA (uracil1498-N3)-methyltransferase
MKLQRFFGDFSFNENRIVINDHDLLHQMKNVFRFKNEDVLVLCDGNGKEAMVEISDISKKEIICKIQSVKINENEPQNKVTLFCAIPKKDTFELIVQKATEVGIYQIIPIITERSVKTALRIDRAEKIAKEAAEQSGRGIIPQISEPIQFKDALKQAEKLGKIFIFDPSGKFQKGNLNSSENISIFIGPEGGFTERELSMANEAGAEAVSLGNLILRIETAAIVSSYLLCNNK